MLTDDSNPRSHGIPKRKTEIYPASYGVCIYSRHLETEQKLEMKSDTDQGQHLAFRYYELLKRKDA